MYRFSLFLLLVSTVADDLLSYLVHDLNYFRRRRSPAITNSLTRVAPRPQQTPLAQKYGVQ